MADTVNPTIGVVTFDLSLTNEGTGNRFQANCYTVDGIYDDLGNLRHLSIGQLVMAICLNQATALERTIVEQMQSMANTILRMETLTGIQEVIVNNPDGSGKLSTDHTYDLSRWPDPLPIAVSDTTKVSWQNTYSFLVTPKEQGGAGVTGITSTSSPEEVLSAVSTALDDLNTVNQEETIQLESLTNKRDQRYDLITNVLKSFNNVLSSIANNV